MVYYRRFPLFPNFDDEERSLSNRYEVQRTRCIPSINVIEDNDSFRMEVAAPGLSREDLKIDLENDTLTLSSSITQEKASDEVILRREFCYDNFERSFVIPDSVDSSKIGATHENGIFRIVLPKKEEAKVKPPREIKIG